jgi:hypothetical protein
MPQFSEHGPWELDVVGFTVQQINVETYRVVLLANGPDDADCRITINSDFDLIEPSRDRHALDAEGDSWTRFGPLLSLRHAAIIVAHVNENSDLRVEFDTGHAIEVTGNGKYERWEIDAPADVKFIGMPSGEPAIWSGDPKRTYTRRGGRWFDGTGAEVTEPDMFKGFRIFRDRSGS